MWTDCAAYQESQYLSIPDLSWWAEIAFGYVAKSISQPTLHQCDEGHYHRLLGLETTAFCGYI